MGAAGTTGAAYIKAHIKPAKALYPSTTSIMYQQVQSKQCDAAIYDIPILFWSLPYQLRIIAKESLGRFPFLGWHQ